MSEVRLIIRDAHRDIHGNVHGATADRVIAALNAEPETIEELEWALARVEAPGEWRPFEDFREGIRDELDGEFVVVDLAARLVAYNSTYSHPSHDGDVTYHDGHCATDLSIRYLLPDDWEIMLDSNDWQARANARRSERLALPPLDARNVLYGKPLLEFIGRECFAAFRGLSAEMRDVEFKDPDDDYDRLERSAIRALHARWLTTLRDDLRGHSPRDVLLAKKDFIERDLQDREQQWSMQGCCPVGHSSDSFAYRFGGFGTHENVVYYYLVRYLFWTCHDAVRALPAEKSAQLTAGDFLTDEVPRLVRARDGYLDAPDGEYSGRSPRSVIERERFRLPQGCDPHEAIVDCDCPLCQMQADLPGPMFWHLDGCNMDDEFAFSFHATQAEWDKERHEWDEFDRRFKARETESEQLGLENPRGGYSSPEYSWEETFSQPDKRGDSMFVRVFSLGSQLAEIIADLKLPYSEQELPRERRELIDRLSRDFGNLRSLVLGSDLAAARALVDPVTDRFCESLDAVRALDNKRDEQCMELQDWLRRILEPPPVSSGADDEGNDDYGDIPF